MDDSGFDTDTLVANIRTSTNMLDKFFAEAIQQHYINPIYSAKVPAIALQNLIKSNNHGAATDLTSISAERVEQAPKVPLLHSMMMTHPVSLNLSTFQQRVLPNLTQYKIAEKNDGIRVWLVLTKDMITHAPFVCMVDRAGNMWMIDNLTACPELHCGTIIDGELLTGYDPEGYTYCMFDAISFGGVDLTRDVDQDVRMRGIATAAKIINWPGVKCVAKRWYSLSEYVDMFPDWEDFDRHLKAMDQTDGLIISHKMSGAVVMPAMNYKGTTPNHKLYPVYKLKPSQTIDLWVVKQKRSAIAADDDDGNKQEDVGDTDHSMYCYMSDDQKRYYDAYFQATGTYSPSPLGCGCGCSWISSYYHTSKMVSYQANPRHLWVMRNLVALRTTLYQTPDEMMGWLSGHGVQLNNEYDAVLVEFTVAGVTIPDSSSGSKGGSDNNADEVMNFCDTKIPSTDNLTGCKVKTIDMRPFKVRRDKARANNEHTINATLLDISGNFLSMDLLYGMLVKQTRSMSSSELFASMTNGMDV